MWKGCWFLVALFLLVGCNCTPQDDQAFELMIDRDGFGSFLPLNNQFPDNIDSDDQYQSGFFAQLGIMEHALHNYNEIKITREDGSPVHIAKKNAKWVDIVCAGDYPQVLEVHEAKMLLPEIPALADETVKPGDPCPPCEEGECPSCEPYLRLLHKDIDLTKGVALVTIWGGNEGLAVHTSSVEVANSPDATTPGTHWHDRFVFSSKEQCKVRVWKSLDPPVGHQEFPPDDPQLVVEVRVRETDVSQTHGSVHHPPWY